MPHVLGTISMLSVASKSYAVEVEDNAGKKTTLNGLFPDESNEMAASLSQYQLCRDAVRNGKKVYIKYGAGAHRPVLTVTVGSHVDSLTQVGGVVAALKALSDKVGTDAPYDSVASKPTKGRSRKKATKKKATKRASRKKAGR